MNIKSREEKVRELLNAVDGANLLAQGKSLVKFAPYKSPDQGKLTTEADRQLQRAMFQLHKVKMKMYEQGRLN
jgi:hypothetical protein